MPRVQKASPIQTVKVAPAADVYQKPASSSRAFGTGFAASLGQVSDVATEHALGELAIQNETRAKELDVKFNESLRALQFAPETGYYNTRGEDAFTKAPTVNNSMEELRLQFLREAENPSQARLLDGAMVQRIEQAKGGVARHAQKEYQSWINAASQARIDDSVQESILSYNNPEYLGLLKQSGRTEILTRAERNGQDQEVTQEELRLYDSSIHAGTVEHLTQIDPRQARAYYEENQDAIDGSLHAKLLRSIRVAERGDLATDWGEYAALSRMSVDDQEGFLALDLTAYQLSGAHLAGMMTLQRQIRSNRAKAGEEVKGTSAILSLAKNSLAAAGIKTSGDRSKKQKKLLDDFQGAALQELEYYKTTHDGRDPSEIEMQEIIDKLLIKGTVPGTGIFFEDEAFMFETDKQVLIPLDEVPDDDKQLIIDGYRRKQGRDPSPDEIRATYTEAQLQGGR